MKAAFAFLPELPLVDRELRILGRRFSTYLARSAFPIVLALLLLPSVLIDITFNDSNAAPVIGRGLLNVVLGLQIFAALVVASSTATSIMAAEKEENALALLVMAGKSQWDVVLSKFLAAYLHVFLLILGLVPMQAMALILGGGDIGVTLVSALLVLALAAAVAAISLLTAAAFERSASAGTAATLLICVWLIPTTLWDIEANRHAFAMINLSPLTALLTLTPQEVASGRWLAALVLTLFVFALALLPAGRVLERAVIRDGAVRPAKKSDTPAFRFTRPRRRPVPALVAAASMRGSSSRHVLMWLLRFAAAFLAGLFPFIGWLFVLTLASRAIVHALADMRQNQTWAEISLIPDEDRSLAADLVRTFRGECFYILAAGLLAIVVLLVQYDFDIPLWIAALSAVYFIFLYRTIVTGAVAAGLLARDRRRCEHAASYRILFILVAGWFIGAMTPMSVAEFLRWRSEIGGLDVRFGADWFDTVYVILVAVMIAWNYVLLLLMSAIDNRLIRRRLRRVYR